MKEKKIKEILDDLRHYWKTHKQLKDNSIYQYETRLFNYLKEAKDNYLDVVTALEYINKQTNRLLYYVAIKDLFKYYDKEKSKQLEESMKESRFYSRMYKTFSDDVYYIDEKTAEKFIEWLYNYKGYYLNKKVNTEIAYIVDIMFHTGLRIGSVLALTPWDIDFNKNIIKVRGKFNKLNIIPISNKLKEKLKKYINEKGLKEKDKLFNKTYTNYYQIIKERAFEYQLAEKPEKVKNHTFRHSFARILFDKTKDIVLVKNMLKHSDIKTTMIYLRPTEQEMLDKFKDYLKENEN